MANQRFHDNTDHGNIDPATDGFPTFQNDTNDRKFHFDDFFAALGIQTVTYATRNSGTYANGSVRFISDGRKDGEGAGAGTGLLCQYNGTNWIAFDDGATITN